MAYNLLGQQGTYGTRNPDPNLSDAEATYLYDKAPGEGDNKGVRYTSYGREIIDKETHNEKAEEANVEEAKTTEPPNKDLSSTSFAEKEPVEAAEVLPPLTKKEKDSIKSLEDLAKYTGVKRLNETQINSLLGKNPEWSRDIVNSIIAGQSVPWWQQMGFDSVDEADAAIARDDINIEEYQKLKKEQDAIDAILSTQPITPIGSVDGATSTATTGTTGTDESKITVYKDGKSVQILQSDLHLYQKSNWTTSPTTSSDNDSSTTNTSVVVDNEEKTIGETQVVVYGPNGARTTANTFKRPGEEMSEYDRLIAGLIPGREGYKNATKSEPLTADYPGDYGGEDASTPMDQRESVVGIGNTDYDPKNYSSVGKPIGSTDTTDTTTGNGQQAIPPPGGIQLVDLNNIPRDSYVWNVDNQLYVAYEVPGAGDVYDNPPMYMAYEVYRNDLVEAGLISKDAPIPTISPIRKEDFDRVAILFSGDTNQLTQDNRNPFASFTETITEQSQVAPWITDTEAIGLIAEAALEGREVTDAEWQTTNWYKTHNEGEREWLRTYYSDPSTATQLTTDAQIAVANSLQAAGVSNAPESMINWVAGKYVSGEWSQTYTTEQINLFADPYATGKRDVQFENYLSSTALTGVDRTTEREREVRELYNKWLGPSLGKLTDNETAEIAGRLRDDPDYQDQLVNSLKQSRLAAFSNYTNPELTYEDIARPWRNLTTSVWGQTADETQGWWQEMVKSNDFAKAQTTLREKGLEQDVTQVTQDATQALQQALGQGSVSQTGVNV
jgi:hypothetical protein